MSEPINIVVIGAGGFGRETLDVIEAYNRAGVLPELAVVGVVDDDPSQKNVVRLAARGYSVLGGLEDLERWRFAEHFVLAVGDPQARGALAKRLEAKRFRTVSVVHPEATVGSEFTYADGIVVCGGVQLSTNVHLGRYVHINPNATIGHDVVLSDFVSGNPGAIVSGEVEVRERALVGAGAVILQNLEVEESATVGAGAVVVRDVDRGTAVVGIPADRLVRDR